MNHSSTPAVIAIGLLLTYELSATENQVGHDKGTHSVIRICQVRQLENPRTDGRGGGNSYRLDGMPQDAPSISASFATSYQDCTEGFYDANLKLMDSWRDPVADGDMVMCVTTGDLNNDGHREIVLTTRSEASGVHAIVQEYCRNQGWEPDQFIISSFNWEELGTYRDLDSEARIAVLTDADRLDALETARQLSAEAINPGNRRMDGAVARALHEAGFKINVWTVNSRNRYDALQRMGVDGVFTDFPDRMH